MKKLELHWQILIAILLAGLFGYFVNKSIAAGVEDPSFLGISAIGFFDFKRANEERTLVERDRSELVALTCR